MSTFIYFSIGLLCTIVMPSLFPSIKLYYFIPFLIRCFYLKPLNSSLKFALCIGLIVDIFSAHSRFGLYSTNYVITTYFLYGLKRNFFEDNFTTLPVMTFFFSLFSTILQYFMLVLLDTHAPSLSLSFILIDFILMPISDSLFALFVFTLPTFLFGKPVKKGSDYFLHADER